MLAALLVLAAVGGVLPQDLVGCGGFVSSPVPIDLSLVEVKLETVEGTLKYSTECAPNGYYFLPLYEKGKFVLRLQPPAGWSFEPTSIDVNVDGTTDKCSLGQDLNFQFAGMSLAGKVLHAGSQKGATGVQVTLKPEGSQQTQSAITGADGAYSFKDVLPGQYEVTATHDSWTLDEPSTTVRVREASVDAPEPLLITGYHLEASIICESEPVSGVNLLVYSATQTSVNAQCAEVPQRARQHAGRGGNLVCGAVSDTDGQFIIHALPSGSYELVPVYLGEQSAFDVLPEHVTVTIENDNLVVDTVFEVKGFSVTGRVEDLSHQPISGADVHFNGKQVGTTNAEGNFVVEHVTADTYSVSVTKEHMEFATRTIRLTSSNANIPTFTPTKSQVCGTISVHNAADNAPREVVFKNDANEIIARITADSAGTWCGLVQIGSFSAEVAERQADVEKGIVFGPEQALVEVAGPVEDINFSQVTSSISGTVSCTEHPCLEGLEVTVTHEDRDFRVKADATEDGENTVSFSVNGLNPGTYKVSVERAGWCWKDQTKSQEVTVNDEPVSGVSFQQAGFRLPIITSHLTALEFQLKNSNAKVDRHENVNGTKLFCVGKSGTYIVRPVSPCLQFQQETYEFDTAKQGYLSLTASKRLVEGTIETEREALDIQLKVSGGGEEDLVITPEPQEQQPPSDGSDGAPAAQTNKLYKYSFWATTADATLTLAPNGGDLLYKPDSAELQLDRQGCPVVGPSFVGKEGLFVRGKITPPLEGVTVTVRWWRAATPEDATVTHVETAADGRYQVGPLQDDVKYEVSASLDGYIVQQTDVPEDFTAVRLATVRIAIDFGAEENDKEAALISFSGNNYRNNSRVNEHGQISFTGLAPGTYFVRPLLKEYIFEPATSSVDVEQGAHSWRNFTATRTAFSVMGTVMSLNGDPDKGVTIEAVSDEPHREEAQSDAQGKFRLRGLKPGSTYTIRIKQGAPNSKWGRFFPASRTVTMGNQDVDSLQFLVFRRDNKVDITGVVDAPLDIISELSVNLIHKNSPNSIVQTTPLGPTQFFEFRSLPPAPANDPYVVRLVASAQALQRFRSVKLQEKEVDGSTARPSVTLQFQAKGQVTLAQAERSVPMLTALVFVMATVAVIYHDAVLGGIRTLVSSPGGVAAAVVSPFKSEPGSARRGRASAR